MAVSLIIEAFDGLWKELENAGLLDDTDASSRRFLFRFITTRAVASCIRHGAPTGTCSYGRIAALWSQQPKGKKQFDPAGTFSRWVKALPVAADSITGSAREYRMSDKAGNYDIRVWFFRPGDAGTSKGRGLSRAGISVAIIHEEHVRSIRPNPRVSVANAAYSLPEALATDDEPLRAEITRVIEIVRQALQELPEHIIQLLSHNPDHLMIKDQITWWDVITRIARRTATVTGVLFLALMGTYCAAPDSLRRKIFFGWSYVTRPASWTSDRPDIYYGPRRIDLHAKILKLGRVRPGGAVRDPATGASVSVEAAESDPSWLRLRIDGGPRFQGNQTKFYVRFGDRDPKTGGYDIVTIGPAAVVEHRYPARGTYPLHVAVAIDALSPEQRKDVPVDFPIDESWGWVQHLSLHAEIAIDR